MPTYLYACTDCGERLEAVQRMSDDALTECPACGGSLRRVIQPVGVVFKGSGFYRTDSRGKLAKAGSSDGDGGKGKDAKDSGKDAAKKDSGSDAKSAKDGGKGSKDSGSSGSSGSSGTSSSSGSGSSSGSSSSSKAAATS